MTYHPTGRNAKENPYYQRKNHTKLAKIDRNKSEFFGTVGGDFLPSELSLTEDAPQNTGFIAASSYPSAIVLNGSTSRNHIAWDASGWPVGTLVQFDILANNAQRALARHGDTVDLTDGQTMYDETTASALSVSALTTNVRAYFGFITLAPGDLIIDQFMITFP